MDIHALVTQADEPRFNQELSDGFAYAEMSRQIPYLEAYMRSLMHTFPSNFTFDGITLTDPLKEIEESIIKMPSKAVRTQLKFDKSRTFMIDFNFKLDGESLNPCRLRLFNVELGSVAVMDGKRYFINQVLVDRGVNIRNDGLYVFVGRTKFVSERETYQIIYDHELIRENVLVAEIHKRPDRKKGTGLDRIPGRPSLFLYLMTKHGATKAIKQYFNLDIELVEGDSYQEVYEQYYPDGYTVIGSAGRKPKGIKDERWKQPNIFMISKSTDEKTLSEVAANFYYLYDSLTTRLNIETVEDTDTWIELTGRFILFNNSKNSEWYYSEAYTHLTQSIDVLLADESARELQLDGIIVKDMYELMAWLISNEKECYNTFNPADISNKRFSSMRFTLGYATKALNKLSYMMAREKGPDGALRRPISVANAGKLFRGCINERHIRDIRKSHNEVSTIQCPVDNVYIANTRAMLAQTKTHKRGGHKQRRPMFDPHNTLHESNLVVAQISGISKADPSGKTCANPYPSIDQYGNISTPAAYTEGTKALGKLLRKGRL